MIGHLNLRNSRSTGRNQRSQQERPQLTVLQNTTQNTNARRAQHNLNIATPQNHRPTPAQRIQADGDIYEPSCYDPDQVVYEYDSDYSKELTDAQREQKFQAMEAATMLHVAQSNREAMLAKMEGFREELERLQRLIEIAARIQRGGNVPASDKMYLMANSPGMYAMAMMARDEDNGQHYESLLTEETGYDDAYGEGDGYAASTTPAPTTAPSIGTTATGSMGGTGGSVGASL